MSHRIQPKLTRTQAEAALEALDLLLADNPADEQARAARGKIDRALSRRADALDLPRGRFA